MQKNQTETQTIQEANATILNFCTILTIFLIKINEHHRKKEMDQLVKEFTTKVNTLNMTLQVIFIIKSKREKL